MRVVIATRIEGIRPGPRTELDWPAGLSIPNRGDDLEVPPFTFEVQHVDYKPFGDREVATLVVFVRPDQVQVLGDQKGWIR